MPGTSYAVREQVAVPAARLNGDEDDDRMLLGTVVGHRTEPVHNTTDYLHVIHFEGVELHRGLQPFEGLTAVIDADCIYAPDAPVSS